MTKDGKKFGLVDKNIEKGIKVENAVDDMIKAIYTKRF